MNLFNDRPLDLDDIHDDASDLFLTATLYFGRTSAPVIIRGLRAHGARIEGAGLPEVGTEIVLRRGKLEALGIVVWAADLRAGLSFRWPVSVPPWGQRNGSSQQASIDRFMRELRHSQLDDLGPAIAVEKSASLAALLEDLTRLRVELGQMGDKLARDIIVVATHPEVQFIDEAMQRIEKITRAVARLGTDG